MLVPESILRRRLTLADYEALPDDADYEIIDGELYLSPRALPYHQVIAARLTIDIGVHAESRHLGTVVPDADLIIDAKNTYISPDIMYFTAEHYARINPNDFIQVIPDLVVEVISPSSERYDLVRKRTLYASLGVPHYWIANPRTQSVEENVLRPDGQYRSGTFQAPDRFVSALFPDLEIDLSRIFSP